MSTETSTAQLLGRYERGADELQALLQGMTPEQIRVLAAYVWGLSN